MQYGEIVTARMASIGADPRVFEHVQSGKQTLDLAMSLVAAQRTAVLGDRTLAITPLWSDHFDPWGGEFLVERIAVVGTIPNKSSGSAYDDACIERGKTRLRACG